LVRDLEKADGAGRVRRAALRHEKTAGLKRCGFGNRRDADRGANSGRLLSQPRRFRRELGG
jgi:hypothetical protein